MSSSLRARLGELVSTFAAGIVDAVRGASLQEISGEGRSVDAPAPKKTREPAASPRPSVPVAGRSRPATPARAARGAPARAERLPRRSLTDIAAVVDQIAALLTQHPEGLRAEQIREALGLSAAELPRPLKEGLATRRFGKSGEKRATTYTLRVAKTPAAKNTKSGAARPGPSMAPAPPAAPIAAAAPEDDDGAPWEPEPAPEPDPLPQET